MHECHCSKSHFSPLQLLHAILLTSTCLFAFGETKNSQVRSDLHFSRKLVYGTEAFSSKSQAHVSVAESVLPAELFDEDMGGGIIARALLQGSGGDQHVEDEVGMWEHHDDVHRGTSGSDPDFPDHAHGGKHAHASNEESHDLFSGGQVSHDDHSQGEEFTVHLAAIGSTAEMELLSVLQDPVSKQLSEEGLRGVLVEAAGAGSGGEDGGEGGHGVHAHGAHAHGGGGVEEDEGALVVSLEGLMEKYGGREFGELEVGELAADLVACQADPECNVVDPNVESESVDNPVTLKLILASALFVVMMIGTLLPLLLLRFKQRYSLYLSLLNCFSGGVFLSAGILHLLPHVTEAQQVLELEYPIGLLLVCLGYYLVFFVERIPSDAHSHHGTGAVHHQECAPHVSPDECSAGMSHAHPHTHPNQSVPPPVPMELELANQRTSEGIPALHDNLHVGVPPESTRTYRHKKLSSMQVLVRKSGMTSAARWSVFIFLLTMSLHVCVESVVLGVTQSKRDSLLLAGAIFIHKLPTQMGLSSRFISSGFTVKQMLAWLVPYNILCPACILIGVAISGGIDPWLNLVFMALATGVFLYVGATEVICEEFEHVHVAAGQSLFKSKMIKFVCVFAGFLVIMPVIFIPEGH